jgi:hypothetical protein
MFTSKGIRLFYFKVKLIILLYKINKITNPTPYNFKKTIVSW